jgi:hypothetical protein
MVQVPADRGGGDLELPGNLVHVEAAALGERLEQRVQTVVAIHRVLLDLDRAHWTARSLACSVAA